MTVVGAVEFPNDSCIYRTFTSSFFLLLPSSTLAYHELFVANLAPGNFTTIVEEPGHTLSPY